MDAKIDPLEGVDLDNSHNKAILIVTSVFFGISLVSVMLRCFVRTQVVRAWGWDDGTMVIAMVSYPAPSTWRTTTNSTPSHTVPQHGLRHVWNRWM